MENSILETELTETAILTPEALLAHWQGHRGLTRKTIEAFPEDKLFTYSIGGMRPFADLVREMLAMALPGLKGIATGKWNNFEEPAQPADKEALLRLWDETTEGLNAWWQKVPANRWQEKDVAFG